MKEIKNDETRRGYALIKVLGLMTLAFLILVLSTASAVTAESASPMINITQITTGGTSPYPVIYGDIIAYPDYRSGWKIYAYDLSTNMETQVSTTGIAFDPFVYGDIIVWEASNGDATDVYMYDLSSPEETRITTSQCSDQPAVYGDVVVWRDCRNGQADIYMYNITTKTETQLTTSGGAFCPDIYGDRIVWTINTRIYDSITGEFIENHDTYLYNLSTQQTQMISSEYGGIAKIYDDSIVIYSYNSLYLYDIPTQKTTSLISTSNLGTPNIYGDRIVYADSRNNDGFSDLYMYNISTQEETKLTNGEIIISDPDIHGDRIVYGRNYNGFDVYMGTLFVEQTPIEKLTPTIDWKNPADIVYGTALGSDQLNAIAKNPINGDNISDAGTFTYDPSTGVKLNAGMGQTLHVKFTPTDTANYKEVEANVTINVLKATPVITWDNPPDITSGTALSDIQLNAAASIPGAFNYTPPSGTLLEVGKQTLHTDFIPVDSANHINASKEVIINVLEKPMLPVANFSSNVTQGYASLSVQFTDLSENATSINWDFENDGNIDSIEENPVYTYASPGTYTVNLTAVNVNGTDSKLGTITVLEQPLPPVANFSSNVTSGYAPLTVQFTDLSTDATEWKWDFGDKTYSTEQNPIHKYGDGKYTVSLTVTNSMGTDTVTKAKYILVSRLK